MSTNNISIGAAYKFAWQSLKGNVGFFFKLYIVLFIIYAAIIYTDHTTQQDVNTLANVIVSFVIFILEITISIGLITIALKLAQQLKPTLTDLYNNYELILKYILASLLYGLIIMTGYLLLIIPGIIWSIKFSQWPYLMVDQKMGPIEALKSSAKITNGAKWELLGFYVVAFLINLLGIAALFVGLLVTMPLTMIAYAHVYQQLQKQALPSEPTATPPTTTLDSESV